MKYGLIFPQRIPQERDKLCSYLPAIEDAGLDFLQTYDHVLGADVATRPNWAGPYTTEDPFHEAFMLLAFAASCTNLELTTGVLVLPQRQTALVAKQAAWLDLITEGRFRLGAAIGWNRVEYDALGQSFPDRGRRLEEQVEILRLLWTHPSVTYEGEFDRIDRAGINPLPIQRPVPVWLGGAATRTTRAEPKVDQVLERIGRLGDGWIAGRHSMAELRTSWDAVRRASDRAGKNPGSLGLQIMVPIRDPGRPEEFLESLEQWRAIGVTHIAFTLGERDAKFEQHLGFLDQLKAWLPHE